MLDILKQGLIITGIGMGLVFVMIFILWGLMALLVFLTNPREKKAVETEKTEQAEPTPVAEETPVMVSDEEENQRLAAALAVAYAVSRPRMATPSQVAPQEVQGSTWLSVGRAQQLLSRNRGRN